VVGSIGCGVRAELHGQRTVRVRDLPIGAAAQWCWPRASGSGAVRSWPARCGPGPSRRS
jgi:hypothetical protein